MKYIPGIFHAHAVVILGTCCYPFLEAVDLQGWQCICPGWKVFSTQAHLCPAVLVSGEPFFSFSTARISTSI